MCKVRCDQRPNVGPHSSAFQGRNERPWQPPRAVPFLQLTKAGQARGCWLMPNRIIRESIRTSETLATLSDGAERLFLRMTTTADDFGRFEGDPKIVRAACFPMMLDAWTLERTRATLAEL